MFRHGRPVKRSDDVSGHDEVDSLSSRLGLGTAWHSIMTRCERAAAEAAYGPVRALDAARDAIGRLHLPSLAVDAGEAGGTPQRQPAFASLSGNLLDKQRETEPGKVFFRGRGVQQVFGPIAEAASRPGGEPDQSDTAFEEERILISELEIRGVDGDLKKVAEAALSMKPNFAYTLKEVKADMQHVFDSGFFSRCAPKAEDTRDGVKLIIEVEANSELRGVVAQGANVLPQAVIEKAFSDQYGRTLNFRSFQQALKQLNSWYEDRGIFGQVTKVDMEGGVVELKLSEMMVGALKLRFVDRETGEARQEGATRPEVILRQLSTRPGQVYNMKQASRDIESVYSMGLFDDVNILPSPTEDSTLESPKMDLTLNIVERKTGGLSAGGGISAQGHAEGAMPGFIGSCSYSQRNLFGLNQKLSTTVEIGQVDSLFRISHTDPWVGGDSHRTSRTINFQNTRTSGNAIHGRVPDEPGARPEAASGNGGAASAEAGPDSNVIVARLLGGVEYGRPLAAGWGGTLGVNWQRARCLDEHGRAVMQDVYGSPLTFSGGESDTMALALLRAVYSGKGPGGGDSQAVVSMEQALPLRPEWLNFNRFRMRAEHSQPLGPYRLLLCGKGGMIVGDLPPYEAFPIGGTNSVRGYSEGGVGSGRNYVAGTAEFQFPLVQPIQGTLFCDYGSDLDSGMRVVGDPAGARGKPGSGYGYGAGVRVDSPVGPLRLEYAFNAQGLRRFHLGIGSHG